MVSTAIGRFYLLMDLSIRLVNELHNTNVPLGYEPLPPFAYWDETLNNLKTINHKWWYLPADSYFSYHSLIRYIACSLGSTP